MYTVLVVDDEPLVRLSLKNMNDWESFGFFFGYEAAHGRQAIEILQGKERIDIVILDINMPVMNGLELIEHIQLMDDKPEILILSSHNDFSLVRQAFKLGVHDYILKTEMEPDIMLAYLKEIASRLEASEKRKLSHFSTLSLVERKYLRRQFLKDLLSGQLDRDITEKTQQFDIRLQEDCLSLAAISINAFDIVRRRYEEEKLHTFVENVINIIAQILSRQPYGEVLSLDEEHYVIFFSFEENTSEDIPKIYEILREFERSLKHYLEISISYGLSDLGSGFEIIRDLYKEAEKRKTLESRIVRKTKRYVMEHFNDPELDLQNISQFIGITKNHLSHQFSKETGEHLRDYIHHIRIEEAKKLLLNTNMKVYEVCYQVGYKNVESFSRIFKKLTGVSPNKYSPNFQNI
jgi:two-component system response regulator YesN